MGRGRLALRILALAGLLRAGSLAGVATVVGIATVTALPPLFPGGG